PKIHIHGVYFLYNSLFGLALNRLVPGGEKLKFVFSPLRNSRCYQTVDFSFFTGETIFRCDLINFTGSIATYSKPTSQLDPSLQTARSNSKSHHLPEIVHIFLWADMNLSFACRLLTLVFFPDDAPIS
ncbi:hypothetical protein HID58_070987, partial [Brassica napus]